MSFSVETNGDGSSSDHDTSNPPILTAQERCLADLFLEERDVQQVDVEHLLNLLDAFLDRWREEMTVFRQRVEESFTKPAPRPLQGGLCEEKSVNTNYHLTEVEERGGEEWTMAPWLGSAQVVVEPEDDQVDSRELVHQHFEAAHRRSERSFSGGQLFDVWTHRSVRTCRKAHASLKIRRLRLRWLEAVAESKFFKATVFAVIVLNTLVIGLDGTFSISAAFETYDRLDAPGNGASQNEARWLATLEEFFFYFYSCELVLRIFAYEGLFFVGPDWKWNWFDSLIVSMSLFERVLAAAGSSSVFRLLRIMRISRSTRSARLLRLFPSLYPLQFMMLSCANCLPALFWTCMLVLVLFFIVSSILTSGIANYVSDLAHPSDTADSLRLHFANMPMCMLTLFLSFLGEAEFRDVILSLLEVDVLYSVLYVMFLIFVTLAVTNVVNGIFINDAMEQASQDRDLRHREELARSKKNLKMLSMIFREMDTGATGFISREDFERQLQRTEVQSLMSYFSFDVTDANSFFTVLDVDDNGYLDIEEFTVGCLRMHGKTNAIDMEITIQETKRLALSIESALLLGTKSIEDGIRCVMETSLARELKIMNRMKMMEQSLHAIEDKFVVHRVNLGGLVH